MSPDLKSTDFTSEFKGNPLVLQTLRAMIDARRLPHAMLFEGQQGCGTYTLAVLFAAQVLCQDQPAGQAERIRRQVEEGSHPDLRVVTSGERSSISVDEVRAIIEDIYLRPNEGEKKIILIGGAGEMTPQAQNALLKVLEEPPEHALFLLTAESRQALLPTVLSRVICFSILPPSPEECIEHFAGQGQGGGETAFAAHLFGGAIGSVARYLSEEEGPALQAKVQAALDLLGALAQRRLSAVAADLYRPKNRDEMGALLEELTQLLPYCQRLALGKVPPFPLRMKADGEIVHLNTEALYREIARGRVSLQRNCNLSLLQASLSDRLARAAHEGGQ